MCTLVQVQKCHLCVLFVFLSLSVAIFSLKHDFRIEQKHFELCISFLLAYSRRRLAHSLNHRILSQIFEFFIFFFFFFFFFSLPSGPFFKYKKKNKKKNPLLNKPKKKKKKKKKKKLENLRQNSVMKTMCKTSSRICQKKTNI